jgi:hypothetical protein
MLFTVRNVILMNMAQTQNCKITGQPFTITDRDIEYYERLGLPLPTLCPEERCRRRFTFRNERNLYYRKSDLSGKKILTCYHPSEDIKVYSNEEWHSDNWDAQDFAQEYDFERGFFQQFSELLRNVPFMAIHEYNNQNSDYTNYVAECKNCYMIYGPVYSEDCMYGSPYYSKDCLDTLLVRDCELCYESITCDKCYQCFFCQDCVNCHDLSYCYECRGCRDCIGCVGLKNKKYHILNQEYLKEDYQKIREDLSFSNEEQMKIMKEKFLKLYEIVPHRSKVSVKVEDCTGNYIYESKNTVDSFDVKKCWDCAYCAQIVDAKDCYDCNYVEENELCCEYLGFYKNVRTHYSLICSLCNECMYCAYCISCHNCFGCVGLKHKQYCILNKQYLEEEYNELLPKVIEDMKAGKEFGEYFPSEISPFSYNETVAQEYFPLTKEEVIARGYRWRDPDPKEYLPEDLEKGILACMDCGKNYRIQPAEAKFYDRFGLPTPQKCPDCRHKDRLAMRPPRELFDRNCDKCEVEIKTSYSPNQPEEIYCENCYLEL